MKDLRIKTGNTVYMIGVWSFLVCSLLMGAAVILFPDIGLGVQLRLSSVISLVFYMFPAMLVISKKHMEPLRARFSPQRVKPHIFWIIPMAVAGFFLFTGLNGLVITAAESLGLNTAAGEVQSLALIQDNSTLTLLLLVGLLPAVSEEFLFRGVVLPVYEARGKRLAVLLSAILFASMHGQPLALPVHFALGCVLGYVAMRSGSIYPAMLYHGLHNSISVLVSKASLAYSQSDLYAESLELLESQGMNITGASEIATYIVMIAIGGALFALFLWGFGRGCDHNPVREAAQETIEMNTKLTYLPLIIGVIAAVILNIIGALPYFMA